MYGRLTRRQPAQQVLLIQAAAGWIFSDSRNCPDPLNLYKLRVTNRHRPSITPSSEALQRNGMTFSHPQFDLIHVTP